jgi:hypothetical protein
MTLRSLLASLRSTLIIPVFAGCAQDERKTATQDFVRFLQDAPYTVTTRTVTTSLLGEKSEEEYPAITVTDLRLGDYNRVFGYLDAPEWDAETRRAAYEYYPSLLLARLLVIDTDPIEYGDGDTLRGTVTFRRPAQEALEQDVVGWLDGNVVGRVAEAQKEFADRVSRSKQQPRQIQETDTLFLSVIRGPDDPAQVHSPLRSCSSSSFRRRSGYRGQSSHHVRSTSAA